MLRTLLITCALACIGAAGLVPAAAAQTPTTLMPGVTYDQALEFTPHGPVALHVVRAPRPGGLYAVEPVLAGDTLAGRETLTALQRRQQSQATQVSVNGDFTNGAGRTAGIVIRDGLLDHAPLGSRSSAGFDGQGSLVVNRVALYGTWRGTGQRRPLNLVNEAPATGQATLFTAAWGAATPRAADAVDVVLAPFPPAVPNTDLAATVTQVVEGGGSAIPPGGAVLQGRGNAVGPKLAAEAPAGTSMTLRLILKPEWQGVGQAIGGGPLLVRAGKAIFQSGEAFRSDDLLERTPRSAVGQLADGRVLLVGVDGMQAGSSVGMTNYELALALQHLGAVWAMALAPGPGSELAFDGSLLSAPPGREQPLRSALSVAYYGVYAPPPSVAVVSPNGDGQDDRQSLAYRVVRRSTVRAALVGPDGVARAVDETTRDPGTYRFSFTGVEDGAALPEGTWRWTVSATDDRNVASTAERQFSLNRTLGALRVAPQSLRLPNPKPKPKPKKKAKAPAKAAATPTLTVSATLTRPATLTLRIETELGTTVATVASRAAAGDADVTWDGRAKDGELVRAGSYVARLVAVSSVGTSELDAPFAVTRGN